jgi:hypothetical protein
MPAPEMSLDLTDAMELGQMLTFIRQWITGPTRRQLAASLHRLMRVHGYDLTRLSSGPGPFALLLGGDDSEQLFGNDQPSS